MRPNSRAFSVLCLPALGAFVLAGLGGPAAFADDRPLTLDQAVRSALEHDENLLIEQESYAASGFDLYGAEGAYDPVLAMAAGFRRTAAPTSSAFSGAPEGAAGPTEEVAEASASLTQLLFSGASVSVYADSVRDRSDSSFDFLSPSYQSRLGFELRQPLWRGRSIDAARHGLRIAAADRERAGAQLRGVVIDTVAAVENAYWTLAAARRTVDVRSEAVALAEQQLDETQLRIESGNSPETEIAQPRSELERRRGDLLAARQQLAEAENALKLLILADDSEPGTWADHLVPVDSTEVEVTPVDLSASMEQALSRRSELVAASSVVTRRWAEADFADDRKKPSLDLVVSYDRYGLAGSVNEAATGIGGAVEGAGASASDRLRGDYFDSVSNLSNGDFDDARVALQFQVPLRNRSARAAADVARSAARSAELDLARQRKSIRAEVLDAAAALDTAGGRIAAARAAREAAEIQLSAEQERYNVGLSTNFLVLTRQNDLASARLGEIAAGTDYLLARAAMGRATGTLLDERGITWQANEDVFER